MCSALWQLDGVAMAGAHRDRLHQIDARIQSGVTAVMGQSGAGKTSLLNLLVGFERPDRGAIEANLPTDAGRLPLYWVPQDGGAWPHLTARKHLLTVMKADDAAAERADQLLRDFDLAERSEAHPADLSQGERSRLAVARALAADPAVLVMDEPLAHVDPARVDRYWRVVRAHIERTGASLVFATHVPQRVLAEAQSVLCLRDGQLIYHGDVQELYWQPATAELAECFGPCNWLEPDEARTWLGIDQPAPRCYRPQQIAIAESDNGALVVRSASFQGTVAEVELEHEPSGQKRRFYHQPAAGGLRENDRARIRLLVMLLMMVFGVLSGCDRYSEVVLPEDQVRHWAMPPAQLKIPQPRAVAIGRNNEVLVLDTAGRVLVFDEGGKLLRHWWMPEYEHGRPEGLCVLADGRIAVADTHYHRVVFFDQQGNVLDMMGSMGKEAGQFVYPVTVVTDDSQHLYVCEYGDNDRVQKFTADGTFVLEFGGVGTEPGRFQRTAGMVWHDGRIYVADAANHRVQVFTDSGQFIAVLEPPDGSLDLKFPYDLALGPDEALYVAEYGAGRITKLSLDGQLLARYGQRGSGPGNLAAPWGLAVDRNLRLIIADTGNRRIAEWRP